ncbi:Biotin carboxyl carrier protein of acetyl-CoA carboxylase [Luteitalea pratensis]|uniref:Biotin carboxyl carrier protein of acetyl-CoA carboxylase n=1 Tax=Luteitalea pratensis TaxID=1855912 RepID=A0A143PRX9_LUTPR|nr:acetyl-CoA carboxylase biotin carboxyl carrier protein [Luteitalea pratensis]AMY10933.1 Biotin carboxyl carrier protein of acetyl-CoA carboxylase [Luteitalea pratensis]
MTLDEIKQILDLVREHELAEFELEQEGVKLRVRKKGQEAPAVVVSPAAPLSAPVAATAPRAAAPVAAPEAVPADDTETEGVELAVVKAPIVGTFYRAAEPTASPFVSVGDTVRKNQVVCLIEAMKLMNEIVSEYDGEIVQVFVENGQPVQYGERLFAVRAR